MCHILYVHTGACWSSKPSLPLIITTCRFTFTSVPNFDWSDPSFPFVMTLYVGKVTRLFRKLALEPQFHQSMWQCLCSIFRGINLTLERNPSLAASWKDLIAVCCCASVNGIWHSLIHRLTLLSFASREYPLPLRETDNYFGVDSSEKIVILFNLRSCFSKFSCMSYTTHPAV